MIDYCYHICYHVLMKRNKILERVLNNPRGIKFSDFQSLVESYDFKPRRIKGSHHIYKNKEFNTVVNIQPLKNGDAKEYQVKDFIKILEDNNVI